MEQSFDAVVIGAGPGGYVCAIRLAQLGKKTAVIEKEDLGGVCLNVGCIPSKALIYAASLYHKIQHEGEKLGILGQLSVDLKSMQTWKNQVVKKLTGGVEGLLKANKVSLFRGNARIKSAAQVNVEGSSPVTLQTKAIIIATGSSVLEVPALPFNGKTIVSSTEALALTSIPKKMVVIGGGFIGLEIGTVYAKLGSPVTIVEATPQLLGKTDPELVAVVMKRLKTLGVRVLLQTQAVGIKEKDPSQENSLHLKVQPSQGSEEVLEADCILVAIGRKPNSTGFGLQELGVKTDGRGNIVTNSQGATNIGGIYAIGDVTGAPQLAHRASMDGLLVAETLATGKGYRDYRTVPWAVFCDPEIASTGLSETEAKEKGIAYRVGKFPFAANGRALSTQETEGLIKVLVEEKTEAILGVQIVGPEASNLIAEATLAIEMGACAEDVVRTIHTHPTLPEAFPEAVENAFAKSIHVFKPIRS